MSIITSWMLQPSGTLPGRDSVQSIPYAQET